MLFWFFSNWRYSCHFVVQEAVASEASIIESEAASYLDEFLDYHSTRAEMASKFLLKPQVVSQS